MFLAAHTSQPDLISSAFLLSPWAPAAVVHLCAHTYQAQAAHPASLFHLIARHHSGLARREMDSVEVLPGVALPA